MNTKAKRDFVARYVKWDSVVEAYVSHDRRWLIYKHDATNHHHRWLSRKGWCVFDTIDNELFGFWGENNNSKGFDNRPYMPFKSLLEAVDMLTEQEYLPALESEVLP